MAGTKGKSGGARSGTGPVRRRYVISHGAAVLLRELTRSKLGRKSVSEAELTAEIEAAIVAAVDARIVDTAD